MLNESLEESFSNPTANNNIGFLIEKIEMLLYWIKSMFKGNQQLLGEISGFTRIAKVRTAGVKKCCNPVCWLMNSDKKPL